MKIIRQVAAILADIHAVRVNLEDCPSSRLDYRSATLHERLNVLLTGVGTGHRTGLMGRLWVLQAACRDADPDLFFGDAREQHAAQRTFCRNCPVVQECGEDAFRVGADFGVWGGLTARERRRLEGRAGQSYRSWAYS